MHIDLTLIDHEVYSIVSLGDSAKEYHIIVTIMLSALWTSGIKDEEFFHFISFRLNKGFEFFLISSGNCLKLALKTFVINVPDIRTISSSGTSLDT